MNFLTRLRVSALRSRLACCSAIGIDIVVTLLAGSVELDDDLGGGMRTVVVVVVVVLLVGGLLLLRDEGGLNLR